MILDYSYSIVESVIKSSCLLYVYSALVCKKVEALIDIIVIMVALAILIFTIGNNLAYSSSEIPDNNQTSSSNSTQKEIKNVNITTSANSTHNISSTNRRDDNSSLTTIERPGSKESTSNDTSSNPFKMPSFGSESDKSVKSGNDDNYGSGNSKNDNENMPKTSSAGSEKSKTHDKSTHNDNGDGTNSGNSKKSITPDSKKQKNINNLKKTILDNIKQNLNSKSIDVPFP